MASLFFFSLVFLFFEVSKGSCLLFPSPLNTYLTIHNVYTAGHDKVKRDPSLVFWDHPPDYHDLPHGPTSPLTCLDQRSPKSKFGQLFRS